MSTGRSVGCKDEQLIDGIQDVQYNGQCHTQLLPQYFVLDRDAVDADRRWELTQLLVYTSNRVMDDTLMLQKFFIVERWTEVFVKQHLGVPDSGWLL